MQAETTPRQGARKACFAAATQSAVTVVKSSLELPTSVLSAKYLASGTRVKRLFAGLAAVKVYVVGFYLDVGAARGALSKHAGKPSDNLVSDAVALDVTKALVIRLSRNVTSAQISDALVERLEPLLGKADEKALSAFKAAFVAGPPKLSRGAFVSLTLSKGGKCTVVVDGVAAAPIASRALCTALQTVYLGSDPVVPSLKSDVAKALAQSL